MTTVIGMQTKEGIVLLSDTQLTVEEENMPVSKESIDKIAVGNFWAMTYVGTYSERLVEFLQGLKKPVKKKKHPIYNAVKRKHFPEVLALNRAEMREDAEITDVNAFLLATTFPEQSLYRVDEFGNLHHAPLDQQLRYLCLGSGRKHANRFIRDYVGNNQIGYDDFKLQDAKALAYGAFKSARAQDMHTGGTPDIVKLTRNGVVSKGKFIEDKVHMAEERAVNRA